MRRRLLGHLRAYSPDPDILAGGGDSPAPAPPAAGEAAPPAPPAAEAIVERLVNEKLAPVFGAISNQLEAMNARLEGHTVTSPQPQPNEGGGEGSLDKFIADPEAFVKEHAGAAGDDGRVQLVLANQADQMVDATRTMLDRRYGEGQFDKVILPAMKAEGFDKIDVAERAKPGTVGYLAAAVAADPALAQTLYDLETAERKKMAEQPTTLGPGMPAMPLGGAAADAELKAAATSVGMDFETYKQMATGDEGGPIRSLEAFRKAKKEAAK